MPLLASHVAAVLRILSLSSRYQARRQGTVIRLFNESRMITAVTKKQPEGCSFLQGKRSSGQLFLDTGRLAGQRAEVVQLGLADIATALNAEAVDHRAEGLEGTLHTHTVGGLAHGEITGQAAVTLADHHAFEGLQTLTLAFLHLDLNDNGVAGGERRQFFGHLLGFEHLDNLVGHAVLLRQALLACHRYVNYRPADGCIPSAAFVLLQKASGYPEDQRGVPRSSRGTAANASAGCVHDCR